MIHMIRWLRDPKHAVFALVFLGVVLRLPSIWVGFGMDDFAQLAMLGHVYPVERAPADLFTFSDGSRAEVQRLMDRGSLAWWSNPELRLSALRPLSSLLTWLDVEVFGHRAGLHHVHSLLWWTAMAFVISRLLLRLLPARWAVLAFAFYVLDECHTYPIGWLANRNAIVSATFGFAAVLAHVRWREDGWRPGAGLSAVLLALALAGGEYGLCAAAYIGAFELVGLARPQRSWRGWLPMIAVLVVWAVIHRAFGFSSQGSTVYVDPLREPIAWLSAALVRVPILVADMLLAIPTGKLAFFPDLMRMQALLGPLALAIVGGLVPGALRRLPTEERRRLVFACLAAILALLPVASSFVSARLLLIPGVAGHVVVAALVLDGLDTLRDPVRRREWTGRLRMLAGVALAAVHIGLATYWGLEETISIGELNRGTRTASLTMEIDDTKVAEQRLVVLTAADPMTLLYPPIVRWVEGSPMPKSWWVLSMAPRPHRLRRVASNAFELDVVGGAMLKGPVEQLFRRPDQPLAVGQVIELDGLRVEILALADGVNPTRVRYTFDHTLDHPSLVFLLATRRGMIRYPMGPVGATVTIPPAALPLTIPSVQR